MFAAGSPSEMMPFDQPFKHSFIHHDHCQFHPGRLTDLGDLPELKVCPQQCAGRSKCNGANCWNVMKFWLASCYDILQTKALVVVLLCKLQDLVQTLEQRPGCLWWRKIQLLLQFISMMWRIDGSPSSNLALKHLLHAESILHKINEIVDSITRILFLQKQRCSFAAHLASLSHLEPFFSYFFYWCRTLHTIAHHRPGHPKKMIMLCRVYDVHEYELNFEDKHRHVKTFFWSDWAVSRNLCEDLGRFFCSPRLLHCCIL